MNRNEFFENLRNELAIMPASDIDDVICYYEELFNEKNGTDEEIIESFGSVKNIANNILREANLLEKVSNNEFNKSSEINRFESIIIECKNIKLDIIQTDMFKIEMDCADQAYFSKIKYSVENNVLKITEPFIDRFLTLNLSKTSKQINIKLSIPVNHKLNKLSINTTIIESSLDNLIIDTVNIKCISGDFKISNLESSNFIYSGVSGDLELNNSDTTNLSLKTINGDLYTQNINCHDIASLSTVNGDIYMKKIECKKISFGSVSGDVDLDINNCCFDLGYSISSISGDININNETFKNRFSRASDNDYYINGKSVSGDITIKY